MDKEAIIALLNERDSLKRQYYEKLAEAKGLMLASRRITHEQIAEDFGVSKSTISKINNERRFKRQEG